MNVCIYRIPRGISVIKPRSFCPACKATLRWYELAPVVSCLFLKGKCGRCSAPISVRYPIIELLCGGVFVFFFVTEGLTTSFLIHSIFFVMLLTIFVIDLEYLIIPNGIIIVGLGFGIVMNLVVSVHAFISAAGSAFLAAILMLAIRWVGKAVFKKETMGMGDVKLSALIGLFIGIENFLIAVWAAAVFGCLYWLVRHFLLGLSIEDPARGKDMKLPFGSFLSLTSFVSILVNPLIHYSILPPL